MSLYGVMVPVVDDYGNTTFARHGARTKNLWVADKAARARSGRVIDLDTLERVSDFYVEPAPAPRLGREEYRAAKLAAQIFRV